MAPRAYLGSLLRFAWANNRTLFAATVLLILAAVVLELAAMTAIYDLSVLASGRSPSAGRASAVLSVLVPSPTLRSLLPLLCGVVALRALVHIAAQRCSTALGKNVQAQLSSRAFARVLTEIPLAEVEERSIGHFITLAGDEAARAGGTIENLVQLVGAAALAVVYSCGIVGCSPVAALAAAGFGVLSLVAVLRSFAASQRIGARRSALQADAYSIFLDALNGLRAVRAFTAEGFAGERYRRTIFSYVRAQGLVETLGIAARSGPIAVVAVVAAVAATRAPAEPGAVDLSAWIAALVFALRLFPLAGQALTVGLRVASESRAGRDVTAFADVVTQRPERERLDKQVEEIALEDVSFAYPGRDGALAGITLRLRAGRSYALVGPSGSGKSTLFDLIVGLREPASGRILVGGRDLSVLDEHSLRERVILVGQAAVVLNDTIAANIAFGRDLATESIRRAATVAELAADIDALPAGYETILGYQGSGLSGGQRQRLCLARALARDPDALLLDECTAGLDGPTRDRIVGNVLAAAAGRIVVFATHDPAVIARVDEVIDLATLNRAPAPKGAA